MTAPLRFGTILQLVYPTRRGHPATRGEYEALNIRFNDEFRQEKAGTSPLWDSILGQLRPYIPKIDKEALDGMALDVSDTGAYYLATGTHAKLRRMMTEMKQTLMAFVVGYDPAYPDPFTSAEHKNLWTHNLKMDFNSIIRFPQDARLLKLDVDADMPSGLSDDGYPGGGEVEELAELVKLKGLKFSR